MRLKLFIVGLLLCIAPAVLAQEDCAPLITAAIESTANACANTARGQACFGSAPAEARARMGAAELVFAQAGDMADLGAMRRLTLGASWGVSLMRFQANLPDNPVDENVTMLAFGDVQITNVGTEALAPTTLLGVAITNANIRALPTDDAAVLSSLTGAQTADVVGRLSDGSWLQISLPGGLQATGWVFAELMRVDGDVNMLSVIDPNVPQYRPMQAFRFHSTLLDTGCADAPQSGILIQTPKDAGRVLLSINNVNVRIGSTAFLQAIEGGLLTIHLLEGSALIDAEGGSAFVPAGSRVTITLNGEGLAAGIPTGPFPYDETVLGHLPLQLLPEAITITPSLTREQIEVLSSGAELTPAAPTGVTWTNVAGLISDTCGGASMGATFPVTMVFDGNNELTSLAWFDLVFRMGNTGSVYVGTVQFQDALYALTLTMSSATTYSADLVVTFAYSPGCSWHFNWDGTAGELAG